MYRRVHTHVGAAHRARRPSHRLALCLLHICAPFALIALGLNLGLVKVQYGMPSHFQDVWWANMPTKSPNIAKYHSCSIGLVNAP